MLKPEQVPDEVVKRFSTWQFPKCTDNLMRRMLADAINAWPGMNTGPNIYGRQDAIMHLPLTQEADND